LHVCPLVFSIAIQQVSNEQQFLFIFAVHHFEDFLTLAEPCIRFIWEALPVNSTGLWRKKSSTVGTLTGAIAVLGYAATSGYIASTMR